MKSFLYKVKNFLAGKDNIHIYRSKSVSCLQTPEFQNDANVVEETVPQSGRYIDFPNNKVSDILN